MDDLINLADVMLSVIEGPYKVCTHYRVLRILYQANKKKNFKSTARLY